MDLRIDGQKDSETRSLIEMCGRILKPDSIFFPLPGGVLVTGAFVLKKKQVWHSLILNLRGYSSSSCLKGKERLESSNMRNVWKSYFDQFN